MITDGVNAIAFSFIYIAYLKKKIILNPELGVLKRHYKSAYI